MIDKSLPSVISAKLLFRRAAAPSSTSTSSYSSSNHRRSTATCLFVHSCIRGVADLSRSNFILGKNYLIDVKCWFLPNEKISNVATKMFYICKKQNSACSNSCIIIVNFLREATVKFFTQRIYVISELNSLAILLSGVDRAKGILGWELRLAARFERFVMSK